VAVLGSVLLFDDAWLDKEENGRLADFLFRWLLPDGGLEVSIANLTGDLFNVIEDHART
jgi:hypothetical protein